jgi:hypothetical protein
MKRVALGLVVLAMAFAFVTRARASSITGDVSIAGLDSYTATSVTFTNPGIVLTSTGSLSTMLSVPLVTFNNITSFSTEAGKVLFDWNHSGIDIKMTILALTVLSDTSKFLNVVGTATMTETGFSPTKYDFSLTSTTTGVTSYTLDALPPSTVPEPGSLLLVGSGLVSLAVLLYRKAKKPTSTLRC